MILPERGFLKFSKTRNFSFPIPKKSAQKKVCAKRRRLKWGVKYSLNKDGETKNRYPRSKLTGYYAIFSFGPFAFKAYRSKLRGIKPREIKSYSVIEHHN